MEGIKRQLAALAAESAGIRDFIEGNLALFNGHPGDPESFALMDELLEDQCYRLSYWQVGSDEINYRRFFDVNDLAALAMEREDVFEAAHSLVLRLVAEGKVDGLRIDHPDGLFDPATYLKRLQEHASLAHARRAIAADPTLKTAAAKDLELNLRDRIAAGCRTDRRPAWHCRSMLWSRKSWDRARRSPHRGPFTAPADTIF